MKKSMLANLRILLPAIFLLTAVNATAETFVFKPQNAGARYSDGSQWLNGNYPGPAISGDTIIFSRGAIFSVGIIDIQVKTTGYVQLDSGFHLIVNASFEVAPASYIPDILFKATDATISNYDTLALLGINAKIKGTMLNHGFLRHSAFFYTYDPHYEHATTNLEVDNIYNAGWIDFENSFLHIDYVTNYGYIQGHSLSPHDEVHIGRLTVNADCVNHSHITSNNFTVSHLVNSQSVSTKKLQATTIVNTGNIYLEGAMVTATIHIGTLLNEGRFVGLGILNAAIGSLINKDSLYLEMYFTGYQGPKTIAAGSIINTGGIRLDANLQANGHVVNSNRFRVDGEAKFLTGSLTNSGNIYLTTVEEGTEHRFESGGYNKGLIKIIGPAYFSDIFLNFGTIEQ